MALRRIRTEHDKQHRKQHERERYRQAAEVGLCARCKQRRLDRPDRKRCWLCRTRSRQAACRHRLKAGKFPTGLYRTQRLDCLSLCVVRDDSSGVFKPGAFAMTAVYLEPEGWGGPPGRLEMRGLKMEQLPGVLAMCRILSHDDRSRLLPALVGDTLGHEGSISTC